jgi:WD40 repeat protein
LEGIFAHAAALPEAERAAFLDEACAGESALRAEVAGKSLATLAGHKDRVVSAQFSADGSRIVTASSDKTACIWTILPTTARPPPAWFADFLRYLAQVRLNSDGELETLKQDDWLALREQMRAVRRAGDGQDTPYLRILSRFVPE